MSDKPEVTAALVTGLGNTLGRAIDDAATRLVSLGVRLDPTLQLRSLVDDVRTLRDQFDLQFRANQRSAEDSRLALRRIGDLIAARPLLVTAVAASPAAPAAINDRQRLGDGVKPILGIGSIGDMVRLGLDLSVAFRSRLMQLRQAAGQPYDEVAERKLGDQVSGAAEAAAMPQGKALDLADELQKRQVPLADLATFLPAAASFAQGQGVSLETTAALVRELQRKAGIQTVAGMQQALAGIAWRGQLQGTSVEAFGKQLLGQLAVSDRAGAAALVDPRAAAGMPADLLQQGVEARRNSPLGQAEAAEQRINGFMQGIGDALLQSNKGLLETAAVVGAGVLAVKAAIGAKQFLKDARGLLPGGKDKAQEVFVSNWEDLCGCLCGTSGSRGKRAGGKGKGKASNAGGAKRGGIVQRARSTLGRALGAAGSRVGGAMRRLGASGVGRAAGSLLRGARAGLRRLGPVKTLTAAADVASIYASDQSPGEKAVGYGKVAGSSLSTVAGAALGTLIPIPVVGTLVGGAIGGMVGEWLGGKAGEQLGAEAPKPVPAAPVPAGPPNWTFAPQVSISVAGNIVNPQQLLDELLPAMRRLIAEAQQERQRNALFDTVVV
ncbi:hypothetical protein [Pseudomonas citronellolis]|uniref:hypothetical protein n=1 Tax=Pseudomonas citronellolis TaxID=53408 RepID=UPI0023E3CC65|nr:hypothetical protein [Pseudomonas citronellolis]MDF3932304.1 hypothetical protein [Pseudomonas citronellolis]